MQKLYTMDEINERLKSREDERETIALFLLAGLIVGMVNGTFGGGGGMIVVPILVNALNYRPKNAHATAIIIMLPICLFSAVTYLLSGSFETKIGIFAVLGNVIGGIIGAFTLKKLPPKWVAVVFSAVMAFAGVKMAFF